MPLWDRKFTLEYFNKISPEVKRLECNECEMALYTQSKICIIFGPEETTYSLVKDLNIHVPQEVIDEAIERIQM